MGPGPGLICVEAWLLFLPLEQLRPQALNIGITDLSKMGDIESPAKGVSVI